MTPLEAWYQANQAYLSASLARLRESLAAQDPDEQSKSPPADAGAIRDGMAWPPALDTLCRNLELSDFERDVLLMCAGVELETAFAERLAAPPSFGLALARLEDAHWSALAPGSPLRRWRLVELPPGSRVTDARLRIDERILHYLAGVQDLDERLAPSLEAFPDELVATPSHLESAREIVDRLRRSGEDGRLPVIELLGNDPGGKRAVASAIAGRLGVQLFLLPTTEVPAGGAELASLILLWGREVALANRALFLDGDDHEEPVGSARDAAMARLIDGVPGLVILATRDPRRRRYRAAISFEVARPEPDEQRRLWSQLLGERSEGLASELDGVTAQFRLGIDGLSAAGAEIADLMSVNGSATAADADLGRSLWDACRRQARPHLDDLAHRIEPMAGWDDLVVPDSQRQALRQIAVHVRHRHRVHERWRLGARCARGLGISALFAGGSGTGKTMAAEVLAKELRLDLYRIDVSSVVSKYIGETEKNLRRVFDAAEEGGVVLLFDEADALFGKRSEVKDSHDRFANIEISYLLQRMEAYKGLAILTTNMKSALDPAFLRRLRFVIELPFPDLDARHRIWQGMFPPETPTDQLDVTKLSRLNVAGGNIRNIALGAAFCAAEEGTPVRMHHLLEAARREYRKLEKPLQDREIRGWL